MLAVPNNVLAIVHIDLPIQVPIRLISQIPTTGTGRNLPVKALSLQTPRKRNPQPHTLILKRPIQIQNRHNTMSRMSHILILITFKPIFIPPFHAILHVRCGNRVVSRRIWRCGRSRSRRRN